MTNYTAKCWFLGTLIGLAFQLALCLSPLGTYFNSVMVTVYVGTCGYWFHRMRSDHPAIVERLPRAYIEGSIPTHHWMDKREVKA